MSTRRTQARRTQAQRREATQANLIAAARKAFGVKGYAETSLEDIAAACDVTIRPIYHYFENKLGMFRAVVANIEQENVAKIKGHDNPDIADIWDGSLPPNYPHRCTDAIRSPRYDRRGHHDRRP